VLADVAEDALDAMLVEVGVLAVGHQVAQQAVAAHAWTVVVHLQAGPVRLSGEPGSWT
jgi:hypothetical protein